MREAFTPTIVIFKKDRDAFSYAPEEFLDGKDICVKGRVKEYKGKAEIIVNSADQITVQ
jgi:micrococcal nuclease